TRCAATSSSRASPSSRPWSRSDMVPADTQQRELVITRTFDAPRELVFQMWTDPKHLAKWWGPRDYPVGPFNMDVRPGGKWRNCLISSAGDMSLWHSGTFREVAPPERLVFTFRW